MQTLRDISSSTLHAWETPITFMSTNMLKNKKEMLKKSSTLQWNLVKHMVSKN